MPTLNRDLQRLMDTARINLPGALDAAIQQELFSVLDDFLCFTNLWCEDIELDILTATSSYLEAPDEYTYPILVADGGSITQLMWVAEKSTGTKMAAVMPVIPDLVVVQAPSTTTTVIARVAKTVTDPVSAAGYPQYPDWVMSKYGTSLVEGVMGRMMIQLAKPYTSPQNGLARLRLYNSARAAARVDALRQNVYNAQAWKFPQSFNARRLR